MAVKSNLPSLNKSSIGTSANKVANTISSSVSKAIEKALAPETIISPAVLANNATTKSDPNDYLNDNYKISSHDQGLHSGHSGKFREYDAFDMITSALKGDYDTAERAYNVLKNQFVNDPLLKKINDSGILNSINSFTPGASGNYYGSSGSSASGLADTDGSFDLEGYFDLIRAENDRQNAWSAEQAQKQMDFQERMSNTAIQRSMADYKEAGLNPVLAAGSQGASTPNGASADASSGYLNAITSLMMYALDAVSTTAVGVSTADNGILGKLTNSTFGKSFARGLGNALARALFY